MKLRLLFAVTLLHCSGSYASSTGDGGAPPPPDGGADSPAACNVCDGVTGLCAPAPECSTSMPCKGLALTGEMMTITDPITIPTCATKSGSTHPPFSDAPPLLYKDTNGDQRAACVFHPTGASAASKRPLLVWIHGAHSSADALYDETSLRAKAESFDLVGDGTRTGFIVAADQGRNLVWPNENGSGSHHDVYYRHYDQNPDFRSVDQLIDALVATGDVDTSRIYLMGWSNGAFFGQLYAIVRHDTPTPGGNRVAAAAVFDGADPFATTTPSQSPSCQAATYPAAHAPIRVVHRACSIVCCDASQLASLGSPPGFDVETWLKTLRTSAADGTVSDVILDARSNQVQACAPAASCTMGIALLNHVRWPDGVADMSGHDWEPTMLGFLRDHPLQ